MIQWIIDPKNGEVLDAVVTKTRDRKAALKLLRRLLKRHDKPEAIVTDKLKSYGAALRDLGLHPDRHETIGRWSNNRAENSHPLLRRRERAILRFRRMGSLHKFAAVHGSVHNHRNQARHLCSRSNSSRTAPLPSTSGVSFWPHRAGHIR
ncbi:DDE-type integrase/transposase/recombinase [Cucumibacter marinus]|uniref:DDE-type integrase/transposase/recombinase n=1 Tax=Cucumibacter marinus TaxID=1121252 RepID=UPI00040CB4A4|nr:DDE-type integrase/transposase/recombinase [Cucumibacter marinus]